jgi:hypothetical protein
MPEQQSQKRRPLLGNGSVPAVVNCSVCESATALQLFVVMSSKSPINPITNQNPVYSHAIAWQYYNITPELKSLPPAS